MSKISKINMSNVTHVLGVSGISIKKTALVLWQMSWKKCGTSRASEECAQIYELLNVQNIQNKYTKCNMYMSWECPEYLKETALVNVQNIMPNAIHVLGVSRIFQTNSPGAWVYVLGNEELPEHQPDVHK